jgi:hypothetical protein
MSNLCFKAESDLPYNETVIHYEEVASAAAIDYYNPSHHPGPSPRVTVS